MFCCTGCGRDTESSTFLCINCRPNTPIGGAGQNKSRSARAPSLVLDDLDLSEEFDDYIHLKSSLKPLGSELANKPRSDRNRRKPQWYNNKYEDYTE